MDRQDNHRQPLCLAIVGGGRTCKYFLDLLRSETIPYLNAEIIGVCDINPGAEGYMLARRKGIYTTTDYRDLFKLEDLDGIIELTGDRNVLLDLIQSSPKRVGILEHNIGRLLRRLFSVDQKLRSAEQQILLEKAISDFLIQQARQRIVIINTDFTIAEANDACLEAVRKTRAQVVGAYCYHILHGLEAPCDAKLNGLPCPMIETINTGKSAQVIHPDPASEDPGDYKDIVTYPVRDADGNIIRVIEIWRDITAEFAARWKKRELELKSNLNKLVQEDRLISLGKLVASCVHEINNPIQGLLTFSHLMKDMFAADQLEGADIEKLRGFADLMAAELDRCGGIISGLLSFSRASAKGYALLDLNEVIISVTRLTRHKMTLSDIHLNLSLSTEPIWISGDRNRLQQCFLNLIFNAMEAMRPGGRLSIRSEWDPSRKNALVRVEDTGHGIPASELDHIFDPFFTTKNAGEGTGLGLSIVYGVVKHHGGHIHVKSTPQEGTRFYLHFPCPVSKECRGQQNGR